MSYWIQIANDPSLLFGPAAVAAVVSGLIGLVISERTRRATSGDVDRKIEAERILNDNRLSHELQKSVSDRAWIDYQKRCDIYSELIENIDVLFEHDGKDEARSLAFMIATRKVRLVGSDEVVWALNDLTNSIKLSSSDKEQKYSDLLCALRVDVRTLNAEPPAGTVLTAEEFPVELMSGSSRS